LFSGSPQTPSWISAVLLLREGRERGKGEEKRQGGEKEKEGDGKRRGEERARREREREVTQFAHPFFNILQPPVLSTSSKSPDTNQYSLAAAVNEHTTQRTGPVHVSVCVSNNTSQCRAVS